jgi:hypothetical protein
MFFARSISSLARFSAAKVVAAVLGAGLVCLFGAGTGRALGDTYVDGRIRRLREAINYWEPVANDLVNPRSFLVCVGKRKPAGRWFCQAGNYYVVTSKGEAKESFERYCYGRGIYGSAEINRQWERACEADRSRKLALGSLVLSRQIELWELEVDNVTGLSGGWPDHKPNSVASADNTTATTSTHGSGPSPKGPKHPRRGGKTVTKDPGKDRDKRVTRDPRDDGGTVGATDGLFGRTGEDVDIVESEPDRQDENRR